MDFHLLQREKEELTSPKYDTDSLKNMLEGVKRFIVMTGTAAAFRRWCKR
jgi:hypothetical protein